ncbi:MAG: N-acetylgalactosamine-6-sulfatase, partial [Cyclobacteriaceae bacterium]
EWPDKINQAMINDANAVSSDVLPTLLEIADMELPNRPIDGISLLPMLENRMHQRPVPIGFWNGRPRNGGDGLADYIDSELQKGTTPLVKLMGGIATRNFKNFHHPDIQEKDFSGPRAWLDNQYKLVIHGGTESKAERELFDVRSDPAEKNNLITTQPDLANDMEEEMRIWQQSVLESLKGNDYQ